MIRKLLGLCILTVTATALLSLSSCAHSQQLESITIMPSSVVFGAAVPTGVTQVPVKLKAYGFFIHPPETKDITTQVTWESDIADVALIDNSGHLTAGPACGIANVSASFYTSGSTKGNVVVGVATVTVDGPASSGCPQGGATHNLSVSVTGGANGLIVSSPTGINCGAVCAASFTSGTTVTLTATPSSGHTFGVWGGCDIQSGTTCSVTMNTDRIVTATFN